MDLKDYKRVSSGSEFRDVVQIPDTEPRFRSNGHELAIDASNSDYVEIDEDLLITTTDDIDLEISFIPNTFDGNTQYLFNKGINGNSSNTRYYIRRFNSNGNALYNLNVNDNLGVFSQQIVLNQTPIIDNQVNTITVKNRVITVNGVANTNLISSSIININDTQNALIGVFGSFTGFWDGSLLDFKYQGETFNPTNIDSNAQIEGSNGTIAQVNSSAADPINYILGTVFQKSGFALELDGGNNEYLEINKTGVVQNLSDFRLELPFEVKDYVIGQRIIILGNFNDPTTGFFQVVINTDTVLQVASSGKSNLGIENRFITGVNFNQKNTLKIIGQDVYLNGVLSTSFSNNILFELDLSNTFSNFNYVNELVFYPFDYQNETFSLRIGLGVELIGSNGTTAEIKTSAANPQQRVNFGMWLKGDDINGWNPYTV